MEFHRKAIEKRFNEGEALEFNLFWGHSKNPGKMTKACLSQWFPCEFTVDGVTYHTSEQFMMAQKALLFGDKEVFEEIMNAETPKEYKALGRKVKNFDARVWDAQKEAIVLRGNIAKFSQNSELKEYLLSTGEQILVEASPFDDIWGVKLGRDEPEILNPNTWRGENLLGCVLMKTRELLRQ